MRSLAVLAVLLLVGCRSDHAVHDGEPSKSPTAQEKVEPNISASVEATRLGAEAESGGPDAVYAYGAFLRSHKDSTAEDGAAGLSKIREAAEGGSVRAMAHLGHLYLAGDCDVNPDVWFFDLVEICVLEGGKKSWSRMEPNRELGVHWLEKAIAAGDIEAAFVLAGVIHVDNPIRAVALYRFAAEAGHTEAQRMLGELLKDGRGVTQDYVEALKWLRLSAEAGNVMSQYQLGRAYESGKGIPRDPKKAYFWFALAAVGGNDETAKRRDELIDEIPWKQLVEVQKAASAWVPAASFEEARKRTGIEFITPKATEKHQARALEAVEHERTTEHSADSPELENVDVDSAIVLASAPFRGSPDGTIKKMVPAGSVVAMLGRETVNGAYEVIDVQSGEVGWIEGKSLKIHLAPDRPEVPSPFRATPKGGTEAPKVTVQNDAGVKIWLRVGARTVSIEAGEKVLMEIPEGSHRYHAWAAGVLPASGQDEFRVGFDYDWVFFIQHSGASGRGRRKR